MRLYILLYYSDFCIINLVKMSFATPVTALYQNNDNHTDNSSNQTTSTADRFETNQVSAQNTQQMNLDGIPLNNENNIMKLAALIEKEKVVLKDLSVSNKKKETKKDFTEIKNNIQMIHHNLDNFFVYNFIKANKKKLKRDE
jgi:hypothetical protein